MTPTPSIVRRLCARLLVALFAVLLALPLIAQVSGVPRDRQLGGFRYRVREFPAWTFKSWRRGEFASTVDAWTRERVGVRGWLIAINRQIRYSLFGQVEAAPRRRRSLVIGPPPMLHENLLIIDALRPPEITPGRMEEFAVQLARIQEVLRKRDTAFLVVLAPNKALIYTDTLPAWVRDNLRGDRPKDYEAFLEALDRHGVPFLDSMALFRDLAPQYPDLVPPHAIHWGHHGAWIAWQRAIPMLNAQGMLPPIPVPETEDLVMSRPSAMNDELRGQLNLLFSRHSDPVPSAYPVAAPLPEGTEPMLDVLLVGDSFGFTLTDALARSGLCRSLHFWFYLRTGKEARPPAFDSRVHRGLPHLAGLGLMPPNDDNGRRMLDGKNLVIFVTTTFNIDKYGWGFDRLVERLYGDPVRNLPEVEAPEVNLED